MMHNRIKNALPAVVFLLALAGYMIVGDHVFERTGPEYVFSYGENQGIIPPPWGPTDLPSWWKNRRRAGLKSW